MRYDPTSGLYESQSRRYSPTLQRWISIDPLRYGAGDADLYRIEGNGPVDRTDPSGLAPDLTNKPLTKTDVKNVIRYFKHMADGGKLSKFQEAELEALLKRFEKNGSEVTGEEHLKLLQQLLTQLSRLPGQGGAVVNYAAKMTKMIADGVTKGIKEAEYEKFAQQMAGTTGAKAQEKFAEIEGGIRAEWALPFFLRYQAEKLQQQLDSTPPKSKK
jgi:RHS repeat-associated protein